MIGLYLKSEDDTTREALVAQLGTCVRIAPKREDTAVMTPSAKGMSLLAPRVSGRDRAPLSWLTAWPAQSLAAIGISSSLRQLRSPWAAALLDMVNQALTPDGTLLVGVVPGGEAKGLWTTAWLESVLGSKAKQVEPGLFAFRRGSGNQQLSVARWFLEDAGRLMIDTLQSELRSEDRLESSLFDAPASPRIVPQRWDPASFDGFKVDATDAASAVHAFNYAIGGVSYKAPILRHILSTLLPKRRDLAILDVGGGTGVVAAELLLTEERVAEATSCDPYLPHLVLSQRLSHHFAERLGGRFRVGHTTAEAMEYDRSYDAISFLGSLLYVPRTRTRETLERAWGRLREGGLLIVHENIRNEKYARDLDHMFTAPELEGFLGTFGPQQCWLSTATVTIDAAEVGDRSVFRVHVKR